MSREQADIIAALETAKTRDDVSTLIGLAKKQGPVSWRPIGDRPNNSGNIEMGSHPGLAIVERITNMMDAMIELEFSLNPDTSIKNPREAAEKYFGIPKYGMNELTKEEVRELAKNLMVVLEDSGDVKRPTIVLRDKGIGQTAAAFPTTLLSLNEDNKAKKPWVMGTYGQGGSVTYAFSEATIIMSRRHPDLLLEGEADEIAWTVVLELMPEDLQSQSYQYLVMDDDTEKGSVFSFPSSLLPDFEPGTRITHVEFELNLSGPYTINPYQFFQSALFDPVLPFVLSGKRKSPKDDQSIRTMLGSANRLRNTASAGGDIEVAHHDSKKLNLQDLGSVTVNYWLLQTASGAAAKKEITRSYVHLADTAVAMTLYGQRQDTEARRWLKSKTTFGYIYDQLIVQIDAEDLSKEAKSKLFASTRERARVGEIRNEVYDEVAIALREDDLLRARNRDEKERILNATTSAASEKVRKRLARYINHKIKDLEKHGVGGSSGGSGGKGDDTKARRKSTGGGKPVVRDTSDDKLLNDPTEISFSRKQMKVRQGERASVQFLANAKNHYLPNNSRSMTINFKDESGAVVNDLFVITSQSALMGGQSQWIIMAKDDTPLGAYDLVVQLTSVNGFLSASVDIEVLPVREAAKSNKGGAQEETGPEVKWVQRENWDDHEFTPASVGRVISDDDSTVIFINRDYKALNNALKSSSQSKAQLETRAERYQFPVACALWLQDYMVNQMFEGDKQPPNKYLEAEKQRMADAVIEAAYTDVELAAFEDAEE